MSNAKVYPYNKQSDKGIMMIKQQLQSLRTGNNDSPTELQKVIIQSDAPASSKRKALESATSIEEGKAVSPSDSQERNNKALLIFEEEKNSNDEYVIDLENVHKTYLLGLEGVAALRGLSIKIKKREFICVFGTSGGGKTTLLNIVGTIDKPTKGNVFVDGIRIRNSTSDADLASLRLNKLSFVFQTFNLISSLTALENVELPMQLKGNLSRTQIRHRAVELLDKVGLSARLNHFPKQLSGGEQQRVTIARALANNPEIMLLDEPTGDLDTKNTDLIMQILVDLNKEGITMIMVSHDLNLKNYAHRVIRVSDGKIVGEELISMKLRDKHINDLYDRVNNPSKEKLIIREGADYKGSGNEKELEAELTKRFPVKMNGSTSVRVNNDYKILRMAIERRKK